MTHDDIIDLLGAYALDAVDPDERELVERHLVECARCRAEVHDHRETAALLAHTGGDAPEGVWERIAGALEEPPPGLQLVPASDVATPSRRGRFSRVAVGAVAAAAVVIAVVLGLEVRNQDARIDELQTALQDPLAPAFETALDAPDSEGFELASADGQIALRGVVTERGDGYLRASALPRLDDDRTYQLWGVTETELISLGVLGARPDTVAFRSGPYLALAVTEEDAPGVVAPQNDPVVSGSMT